RGFLLTGEEEYLAPYTEAIAGLDLSLERVRTLWPAASYPQVDRLVELVHGKRAELGETIALRRQGRLSAAEAIVRRGRGRQQMDDIRAAAAPLRAGEAEPRAGGGAARGGGGGAPRGAAAGRGGAPPHRLRHRRVRRRHRPRRGPRLPVAGAAGPDQETAGGGRAPPTAAPRAGSPD